MVSLKKLSKNNLAKKRNTSLSSHLKLFVKSFFQQHHLARPTLLVAYSGGLDSSVLLHSLHQLQRKIPFHLHAMHVHHGLSDNANDWAAFCDKTCADLGVPFESYQVSVDGNSGLGTEAAARAERYQALNTAAVDFICLAHHQDDQAETLLLQLARGAGVKGLAGMAQVDLERRLIRPFLHCSRADLLAYAEQYRLQWIDDESNADTAYDRNFIRHALMPVFHQRYTSITNTLARSATHMAEASELLNDLAELDAEHVVDVAQQYGVIQLEQLVLLSQARQGNVIRFWLASNRLQTPSAALLTQILQQLKSEKPDASIQIKVADNLHVMRYKKRAYLVNQPENMPPINLIWQGEKIVILPNRSRLLFTKKKGEGFAYQRGGSNIELRIKNREGGESFRPALGRPRRGLKAIMQSSQIPPWLRVQLPLIFMNDRLVIIPDIGVDAEMQAESHEMGLIVSWVHAIE
ncbi:MAG: tRNA lysidine(34) synthetase TilS [Methylophilaceae bacterium]|jgi:tRNA(Ile)-lysidine synthase